MKNIIFILILLPIFLTAQSRWKRSGEIEIGSSLHLFHSSQTANLPTTEILEKGDFLFEISHRFGLISGGYDELYGFDGPVKMRIALGYGLIDNVMITMGRSSVLDNLDFAVKYKVMDFDSKTMPSALAINGGMALNSEPSLKLEALNTNYMQYYFQIVYNVMFLDKKLGIGIVPSVVHNSYIFAGRQGLSKKNTLTLGTYYQYHFTRLFSLWAEFNPVLSGYKDSIYDHNTSAYTTIAFGTALDTGGHVFNLFITNNSSLNLAQYLVGSDGNTGKDAWRLAFGILRVL